jgi:phosphatidate cytidylyltransferase
VLRTRLLTAAVAIPALWLIVWKVPDAIFAGFIVAVTAAGLFEYFAMAFPERVLERVAGIGLGLAVAAGVVTRRPEIYGAALALTVVAGFVVTLFRPADLAAGVQRMGLTALGVLYVGFFTPHVVLLRHGGPDGWRWVLFGIFVAMGSDTGGYFTGRYAGRRKLMPAVSPSKTVEGAVGAVLGAMLVAMLCRLMIFSTMGFGEALGLGATISVLAQVGDLAESALKRAFGAKDSGWIIPGHGGILDRLDSLLFPMVFVYYYAAFPRG